MKMFVAKKDMRKNIIYVVPGSYVYFQYHLSSSACQKNLTRTTKLGIMKPYSSMASMYKISLGYGPMRLRQTSLILMASAHT